MPTNSSRNYLTKHHYLGLGNVWQLFMTGPLLGHNQLDAQRRPHQVVGRHLILHSLAQLLHQVWCRTSCMAYLCCTPDPSRTKATFRIVSESNACRMHSTKTWCHNVTLVWGSQNFVFLRLSLHCTRVNKLDLLLQKALHFIRTEQQWHTLQLHIPIFCQQNWRQWKHVSEPAEQSKVENTKHISVTISHSGARHQATVRWAHGKHVWLLH